MWCLNFINISCNKLATFSLGLAAIGFLNLWIIGQSINVWDVMSDTDFQIHCSYCDCSPHFNERNIIFRKNKTHFQIENLELCSCTFNTFNCNTKTTITNLIVDEMLFHMSFSCVKLPAAFVSLKYNQKGFGDRNKERK